MAYGHHWGRVMGGCGYEGLCFAVEWSHLLVIPQRPGLPRLAEGEQVSTWSLNETLMTKYRCSCCEGHALPCS